MESWYQKQTKEKKEEIKKRVSEYNKMNPEKRKEWLKKNRETHKEQNKKYKKEYRQRLEVKEQTRIYQREYNKDNREIRREIEIRYSRSHPLVEPSHQAVRYMKMDSKCKYCGEINNLQKHHPDYSKPKEFITVCKNCHTKIHQGIVFSEVEI